MKEGILILLLARDLKASTSRHPFTQAKEIGMIILSTEVEYLHGSAETSEARFVREALPFGSVDF